VGATQVLRGPLLLIGRSVPLAIALSGPVIVNIVTYHLTMDHCGAAMAAVAAICWLILFCSHRASFAPLWVAKPETK
jgi:hypothetical protein